MKKKKWKYNIEQHSETLPLSLPRHTQKFHIHRGHFECIEKTLGKNVELSEFNTMIAARKRGRRRAVADRNREKERERERERETCFVRRYEAVFGWTRCVVHCSDASGGDG